MTDEVLDFMQARENNTVAGAIGPVLDEEHNVDDANRAVELSRVTGVPSNVIYPNVKEFDKQNQTKMIAQLLRQDAKLRDFADSQPIVPKIATNDWGSLAKASDTMTRLAASPIAWATTKEGQEVWKAAFEGAREGWGPDTPFYVTEQGIKNVEWAKRNILLWSMFYYGGLAFEGTMRGVSAAVGAGAEGMGKLAEVATGSEKAGEEVKKGIHVAAEYAMTDLPAMQLLHARQMRVEQDAARLQPLKDAAYAAKPWIDAGVEPPVGVHPFIDELKKAKAKNDIRMLDEAIRDFDAIPMKKSAPEILAELPKSHTDKEIGISAEAVRKLYGDAKPEPEDGKLGWVPELESRLRAAELSNGDVNVPLAEYVARVDKAVHDELKEDIRFHEEGVTLNEAKELEPVRAAANVEAAPEAQPIQPIDPNVAAAKAIRQQGDFKPLLDRGLEPTTEAGWKSVGFDVEAKVPDAWTPVHDKIIAAVGDYLGQILPDKLQGHIPTLSMRTGTHKVAGLFREYKKSKPIIFWALDAPDIFGTVRHEAIHALRRGGYITEKEWNILARAVRDEELIDRYGVEERYGHLDMEGKIEEAVAEHFKYWDRTSKEIKSGPVKEIFAKLQRIKDGVYSAIAKVWGKEPSVHEIFGAIESGEVGRREGKSITPGAFSSAMDVGAKAGETVEEKAMATAKALGLSEREMKIYQQRIAKQNDELMEFTKRRAMEDETRRQTAEWKAEAKAVRQEVLSDTEKMPDLVAENYFRNGEYLGQKLAHKPKIDPSGLSDYEKRALPKGITAPGGADPDTIASLLGFNSGKEMLSALSELEHARGEMPMGEFLKQKIDTEVARRMEERHGDLAENILAEAREHVLSQTQLDIMHQETLAMAAKAGAEFTFTLNDIKGWIRDEFANARAQGVKASRYISEAGRAGRRMEKALLEGGFGDAFKEAQHRQFAALRAKEAAKFEKEVKRADKIMSRFQRRPNIKSIAQPYTDQAQALILQVGEPIRRTQENLQLSLQAPVLEMRLRGVLIDQTKKADVIENYYQTIDRLETQLTRIVGEGTGFWGFNWRSNDDLKELFYSRLAIPIIRKKGKITTDRTALEKLDAYLLAAPICNHLIALRELGKRISMLKTDIDLDDRFRTSYNIAGTNTYRFSSSASEFGTGGNAQNIEDLLRQIFIADPEMKMAYIDARQIQSRIVGAIEWNLFEDGRYLDACEGGDLHTAVARLCWPKLPWTQKLEEDVHIAERPYYRHYTYRFMCKKIGHGTNFGGKPPTIAQQAKIEIEAIQEFQPKYFLAFPAHLRWHNWVREQLYDDGVIYSITGQHKRQFWGRRDADDTVREALAFDPQCTEAFIVNNGMLNVWGARSCELLMQNHDAIIVQFPEEKEDELIPQILKQLEHPVPLEHGRTLVVPYDCKTGWNWGEWSKDNPDGLKKWQGGDQRRRTPPVKLLDRKVHRIHRQSGKR